MVQIDTQLSTGLSGLDSMLKGLIPGDNIVWQIDSIEDYRFFVKPYCESARAKGRKAVYFRFAQHDSLMSEESGAEIYILDPKDGFEAFISELRRIISSAGHLNFYVFDCLSDLAAEWYSDRMLGNFFMLMCPFILDIEAIAYFAVYRDHHCTDALIPIHKTAQVVIDVFRHRKKLYVHPFKVQQRYSSTMYMLHLWEENQFTPVTESAIITQIMQSAPWPNVDFSNYRLGVCNRSYIAASDIWAAVQNKERPESDVEEHLDLLLKMFISRDPRVLELAKKYLTLDDVLSIRKQMIGTGLIGGKSVGMLVARAILKKKNKRWEEILEPHDSFYVGSDVFYTYIVQNGNWWIREKKKKDPESFIEIANEARHRMLTGRFSEQIRRQFQYMLDYFGQSPIIVRSSSLLEDNYGNAFSGKYESVFCANQGSRDKRLEDFLTAVRTVYASTMSEKALLYRKQRGLIDKDEQMALLVQRVSGSLYGNYFFPQAAGVGYSYNPYAWTKDIDPHAGMIRLVFGLGTRAVDRSDDDYTRVVSLNAPQKRPEANFDKVRQYSQRKVDVIDLEANQLISKDFSEAAIDVRDTYLNLFASHDRQMERLAKERGAKPGFAKILTFDSLLKETDFVNDMRDMLSTIENAYGVSVDTEFAVNFFNDGKYKINLLQCRPFHMKRKGQAPKPPAQIDSGNILLESYDAVIGHGRHDTVDRIIYVEPDIYGKLPMRDRYSIARLIGKLNHHTALNSSKTIMLIGPGRWGSSMPALGVPVSFFEINNVSILCEIVAMNDNLIPDISLGTHFFNDMVEAEILYLALFPHHKENILNKNIINNASNMLSELIPESTGFENILKVIDTLNFSSNKMLRINADTVKQRVLCYLEP